MAGRAVLLAGIFHFFIFWNQEDKEYKKEESNE
jgi:hypothetical protein